MTQHAGGGSWLVAEELFERGEPAFVDELRRLHDADRLGAFAARWYGDPRPVARRLLFDYLGRPLNAFRHEPLVKRLFKLAEAAGDDLALAHVLVLFDRSLRRIRRKRRHTTWATVGDEATAEALVTQWKGEGAEDARYHAWGGPVRGRVFGVYGRWTEEQIVIPRGTAMPRGADVRIYDPQQPGGMGTAPDWVVRTKWHGGSIPASPEDLPEGHRKVLDRLRLFSVHTRHYLRRRAWRYFRRLGKERPERYVPAAAAALRLYTDEDVADGLALLDNWGLVHLLFHLSPALRAKANGWVPAPGHTLAELKPAPAYPALWAEATPALFGLLRDARCRPVRQWAIRMVRRQSSSAAGVPLEDLLTLLAHADPEVVALAAQSLRSAKGLEQIGLNRWLALLQTPSADAIEIACELMRTHLKPEQVPLSEAVRLARSRPVPAARLGFDWLRAREPIPDADAPALLELVEAEAEPVRPEMVRWARRALGASPLFRPDWVLEYLDSRHADVRAEGWSWLQEDGRVRDDVGLWQQLLESPYDDVRLRLVAELERRVAAARRVWDGALDAELVRFLWAAVLLNISRGSRTKPLVVGQIVQRLARHPSEASQLLPILAVALRSVRGPEWRAGLAGVMRLVEKNPPLEPVVRASFPELSWETAEQRQDIG